MQLIGERTRPACRRRRPGDDFVPPFDTAPMGGGKLECRRDWAGRPIQQASGLRSPPNCIVPVERGEGFIADCGPLIADRWPRNRACGGGSGTRGTGNGSCGGRNGRCGGGNGVCGGRNRSCGGGNRRCGGGSGTRGTGNGVCAGGNEPCGGRNGSCAGGNGRCAGRRGDYCARRRERRGFGRDWCRRSGEPHKVRRLYPGGVGNNRIRGLLSDVRRAARY